MYPGTLDLSRVTESLVLALALMEPTHLPDLGEALVLDQEAEAQGPRKPRLGLAHFDQTIPVKRSILSGIFVTTYVSAGSFVFEP